MGIWIDVDIDENSVLFPDKPLYGYEIADMIPTNTVEAQLLSFQSQKLDNLKILNRWEGVYQDRVVNGGNVEAAAVKVDHYGKQVAMADGACKAMQHLLDHCDIKGLEHGKT